MSKKGIALIMALVSIGTVHVCSSEAQRPNILYIFADDQSRRTVSAYEEAHDWINTPNLDALASSGMRFRTCYTGASCQMSRAMMLTGKLQHAIQSFDTRTYPGCEYDPEVQPFWPAAFRRQGYYTGAIGKWHLGEDVGQGRDWDYSVLWDRLGPRSNRSAYYHGTLVRYNGGERVMLNGYSTDRYTDLAVSFIEGRKNTEKPWFLWLCYGGVHAPFTPADRHEDEYGDAPDTEIPEDIFGPRPTKPEHLVNYTRWNKGADGQPEGFDAAVKKYNRAVASLDNGVGRVVAALRESGQLENTLIVYTSDQGFAWGQHGSREKWMGYDANIAAPLIISLPSLVSSGTVSREPVTGLDIVRTFHSLAGVEPEVGLHGRDMTPLLKDHRAQLSDPLLLSHTARVYGDTFLQALKATEGDVYVGQEPKPAYIMMREGRYKYIRHMKANVLEELYDLEGDPRELRNLAVEESYQSVLVALRRQAIREFREKDGEFTDYLPDVRKISAGWRF